MKTLILFAHHDLGSVIDPHVIRYIQELRTLGDTTVIFVSDTHNKHDRPTVIDGGSLAQLTPLVNEFYAEHTPSHDFGSWRIAWDIAQHKGWLKTADRLVLANDSVYGGLYPLKDMWKTFKGADMYGAIESEERGVQHYESFFLAFDLNPRMTDFLTQFWEDFEFVGDIDEIIVRYEFGLSEQSREQGLTQKVFVSPDQFRATYAMVKGRDWYDDIPADQGLADGTWFFWYGLIHYHRFPFLKVKVARMKERGLREVVERHTEYPFHLIENHVDRINGISWLTQRGDPRMTADPKSM